MENGGKDVKVISNFSRSKTGILLLVLGLCAFVFVLYTLSYRRGGIDLQDFDFEDRLKAGETWKSGLEEMVDVPEVELPRPKQSAINCRALLKHDVLELEKANSLQNEDSFQSNQLQHDAATLKSDVERGCERFRATRKYITKAMSREEAVYPLLFSMYVTTNAGQAERLLHAIYRPQNLYCLYVSAAAEKYTQGPLVAVASCFQNVYVTSETDNSENSRPALAHRACMDYLKDNNWKYFIAITSDSFPLKTNQEIVEILRLYNSANDISGEWQDYGANPANPAPGELVGMDFIKGLPYFTASRDFVKFTLQNPSCQKLWTFLHKHSREDEFFATVQHNTRFLTPGGFLGGKSRIGHGNTMFLILQGGRDPCNGHFVTSQDGSWEKACSMGIYDLYLAKSKPHLFTGHFEPGYNPVALDCLEEAYFNNTANQKPQVAKEIYSNFGFVRQARPQ